MASATNNYLYRSGRWRDGSRWRNANWPGGGDTAWIGDGKTIRYDYAGTTTNVDIVYIGHSSGGEGGNGTFNMQSGRLNINTTIHMRRTNRTATINQTGGNLYVNTNLNLSYSSGTSGWGNYNLNGGNLYVSGNILHSGADRGRLYIDGGNLNMTGGGSIDVNLLRIGDTGGTTGSFTYGANNVTVSNSFIVGTSGTGTYTQTGGTVTRQAGSGGDLWLGNGSSGDGTYNLQNGILNVDDAIVVGRDGTGTFNFSGGTINAGRILLDYGSDTAELVRDHRQHRVDQPEFRVCPGR